ncbi:MAG: 4-alpha-glucanotransferase [Acidimicrobiia bacterium]|nr:4-alpha-glucanotransferase [Acidimicrobiia bacterium]
MRLTCCIRYHTAAGESLDVVVAGQPTLMSWLADGWWSAQITTYRGARYHYRVMRAGSEIAAERTSRVTPDFAEGAGSVVDRWRQPDPADAALTSALFRNALQARHEDPVTGPPTGVIFTVLAPEVPPGLRPGIIGAGPALGDWDQAAVIPMQPAPFPWWRASVTADAGSLAGTEYKAVLLDGDGAIVLWEPGANRTLPPGLVRPVVVNDDRIGGSAGWRGAGVGIPVFSLRTARSVGVGQFTDLIPFVDWAADAGMSVVQLLPVNDTVKNHDWDDSYPYDVVSVSALHPMYLDLDDLGAPGITVEVSTARTELEAEPEVAYERVMDAKQRLGRRAYQEVKPSLGEDTAFAAFVDDEWEWLGPYSMWCLLRDRNGTAHHSSWGPHHRFDMATLQRMSSTASPEYDELQFHWWLQYQLHRQLAAAASHARRRGVSLKGDLPIGVSPTSVETWVHPRLFHLGAQAGAPPDAFAVRGQNWGFPTYDWEAMSRDGFAWWRDRFRVMARYVDAYRIDHVLGFFRIWEIPPHQVDGLLGRFRPCRPLTEDEVRAALGEVDLDRLLRPAIDVAMLKEVFAEAAPLLCQRFFTGTGDDLRLAVGGQRDLLDAIDGGALDGIAVDARPSIGRHLLDLAAGAILLRVGDGYQPRISWDATERYRRMTPAVRTAFDRMAADFFHHRHDRQWEEHGRRSLPAVLDATDMLACGEDLGMVPAMVPRVMNQLGLLSLEIERMPKTLGAWISDPAQAPYLSVVSPGTHDTSPLVEWWREDPEVSHRYWRQALGRPDPVPAEAGPDVIEAILRRHLASPAMLCIVPIADLIAVEGRLRRHDGLAERINQPADRYHRWSYRMHLTVETLAADTAFTARVRHLITDAAR